MIVGDIQDMEALENQEAAQAEALENQEAAQAEALENQEAAQADLNAAGAGEVRGAYIDDYVSEMAFRGLFIQLFSEKELSIVMVGLDASGKTTILDKLKLGEIITRFHNDGFYMEAVQYRHINVTAWEVGRPDLIVPLWRQYMGLIFVVDCLDRDRIVEARHELHRMLNENELEGAVLLVFANKQDLPNAMKAAEITEKLGLRFISRHVWHIQESSATYGQGLYEGLDWFLNKIANKSVAVDLTSRVSALDLT